MKPRLYLVHIFLAAMAVCTLAACDQRMRHQPKYNPLSGAERDLFSDGASARVPPAGTIPRGQLHADAHYYLGLADSTAGPDSTTEALRASFSGPALVRSAVRSTTTSRTGEPLASTFPYPVTREVLLRGQERFNIYCSPCHGRLGDGDGMIVARGYSRPPSLHEQRLRDAPVGYFFRIISEGYGRMPSYAQQVMPQDRWSIIAYIRALQLSQDMRIDDLPAKQKNKLLSAAAP